MRKIKPFQLGLFVLICGSLAIGALIWIGVARFFENATAYVAFFDTSVGGLENGAPVEYLGLTIGRVDTIGLAPDGRLIRVVFGLRPDFKVDASMAVSLRQQGITGQHFLAIGKAPSDIEKVTPAFDFPAKLPVIRSAPGQMEQIRTGVENLYRKIENLDLEGLVGGWRGVARDLSAVLASGDMQATLADIRESAARLKEIATGLARPDNRHALNAGIEDMAAAAASAKAAGKALKTRLDSIPPDALANIAERADRAVTTGETAVTSLNRQVDQSLLLLQQSVFEINQLLSELKRLVQSLQEEPGRILVRPKGAEPFRR